MSELQGKRILTYLRVSTEEQARNGESIADQRQALRKWAEQNGCVIVHEFADEGFSARKPYRSRPALCALLNAVERQEADAVVFTKLDRWFRNVRDYAKVQEVLERCGVFWMATLEDYETRTSAGRFKVNLMLSLAEHEADQTSERIKFTFQQKRARGEIISGNMPKGYLLQNGKPVKDPATAPGVAAFWAEYLASGRLSVAMDQARAAGLPMAVSTGSFMLRNAAHYAGQIQGCPCEPYITPADCDRILVTRKPTPRRSGRPYLFSGMIFCAECSGRMGAHQHFYKRKTGMDGAQVYYNCTTHYRTRPPVCPSKVNIYERDVEGYILERLEDTLERCAVEAELRQQAAKVVDEQAIAQQITRLEQKKARCLDAYLDGFLEKEAFQQRQAAIDDQLTQLRQQVAPKRQKKPEEIRAILPAQWRTTYDGLDLAGRRRFWFSVLDRVTVSAARDIRFTLAL